METIEIKIFQADVYEEVAKATDYTGSKLAEGDEGARDRILITDDDLDELGRMWEESVVKVNENFKEMLVSGETTGKAPDNDGGGRPFPDIPGSIDVPNPPVGPVDDVNEDNGDNGGSGGNLSDRPFPDVPAITLSEENNTEQPENTETSEGTSDDDNPGTGSEGEDNGTPDDTGDEGVRYKASLEVSVAFDRKLTASVQSALRSYFIASIVGQWFKFANRGDAPDYFVQATAFLKTAERLLYTRRKPARPTDEPPAGTGTPDNSNESTN